jgi:hypothetical protein
MGKKDLHLLVFFMGSGGQRNDFIEMLVRTHQNA